MRYLLVALMIVLLPLRGWAGNVMAVDMAAQQVLMAQTATVDTAIAAESAMPADCPMQAQAAADKSSDAAQTTGSHCNGCNTCQLCLTLASFTWTHSPAGPIKPHAAPSAIGIRFSNADSVASLKPPIS